MNKDWITDGWIDFEYKKYLLLAYLQYARKHFDMIELYPPLSELIDHYRYLKDYSSKQGELESKFPGELKGIDLKKLKLVYKKVVEKEQSMEAIEEIIQFAIPEFEKAIKEGKDIYDFVEEQMVFEPVGISPLYKDEGFLFIQTPMELIQIFRYQLSRIFRGNDQFQSLQTELIRSEPTSLMNGLSQIKLKLREQFKELVNPATYIAYSDLDVPVDATLLPLAKRALLRELNSDQH